LKPIDLIIINLQRKGIRAEKTFEKRSKILKEVKQKGSTK
jgi:hypothetical protein